MKKVLIVGGVSYDRIISLDSLPVPEPATVFSKASWETVGSTGVGKALNLARLGFDTALHTPVGGDEAGSKVRAFLLGQPVRTLYFNDEQGTETHTNLMGADGGRISIYTSYAGFEPAFDPLSLEGEIAACDFLVLNIINYARTLIPLAKKHKKKIWCDLHDYDGVNPYHADFVEAADFVFLSADKMPDFEAFQTRLLAEGKELVVVTQGKEGAVARNRAGQRVQTGILKDIPLIDTNGAGDAFFAGFLYGFSLGLGLKDCMERATVAGGLCVSSFELYHPELSPSKVESMILAKA